MSILQNFAYEENLVRIVNKYDEPWFVGKDVCSILGLKNHNQALAGMPDDEREGVIISDPHGKNEQTATAINEPGLYRLIFKSRKPEAERFKKWVCHEVLPQIRKSGQYVSEPFNLESASTQSLRARIDLVREARALFGTSRAASLWGKLGMPMVPPPAPTGLADAQECLQYLLNVTGDQESGKTIRDWIEEALNENEQSRMCLKMYGIRVNPDSETEGFTIANRSPELLRTFAATQWAGGNWFRILRRLPDTVATGPMKFETPVTSRGTWIPAQYLDQDLVHLN